ncbi:MAG: ferritin family protein [Myxococcota bacterium]|jgi:rubrerythrin|nr:ferritin family protein [Myxococcota bacterium]
MIDPAIKLVAEGILSAMQAENEGQHFYLMAAQTTSDPKGREVFERLAKEEQDHLAFLRAQYESVLRTGKPDVHLKLGPRTDLLGPSPIFSPALRARIKDAHYEMTALAVGIQLEKSAQDHYASMAAKASDPTVKQFFSELSQWEAGHYHALLAQQEELKEDYWAGAGFSPF